MPPRVITTLPLSERAEALTRRRLLALTPGILALAGGISCGDEGGDSDDTTAKRTIEHMFGKTEISGSPKRVVTVGWTEQDAVLALGVVPIAVPPCPRSSATQMASMSRRSPRSSRT